MILVIQTSSNIDCLFLFGPSCRRNSEANEIYFFSKIHINIQNTCISCVSQFYPNIQVVYEGSESIRVFVCKLYCIFHDL